MYKPVFKSFEKVKVSNLLTCIFSPIACTKAFLLDSISDSCKTVISSTLLDAMKSATSLVNSINLESFAAKSVSELISTIVEYSSPT